MKCVYIFCTCDNNSYHCYNLFCLLHLSSSGSTMGLDEYFPRGPILPLFLWLVTRCILFAPDPLECSLSTSSIASLYFFCPVTEHAMSGMEVSHTSSLQVQTTSVYCAESCPIQFLLGSTMGLIINTDNSHFPRQPGLTSSFHFLLVLLDQFMENSDTQ